MPDRQDDELATLYAVEDVVMDAAEVQPAHSLCFDIGDLRADTWLQKEQIERRTKIVNERVRRRQPVLAPPPVGLLDLRSSAKADSKLKRHC